MEILTIAPELEFHVPASYETLTSLASPQERTRFYSALRTLRLAHGLTDFLLQLAELEGPLTLIVENAHACGSLDAELLPVLLRRANPSKIKVIVSSSPELQDDELCGKLEAYALRIAASSLSTDPVSLNCVEESREQLLAAYFETECTSDSELMQQAYASLTDEERRARHDSRAELLSGMDQQSLRIGAIPYHLENGSNPSLALESIIDAVEYCSIMGFYEALIDLGKRGWELTDWNQGIKNRWLLVNRMTTSYAALDHPKEGMALYEATLANTNEIEIHMRCYYGLAMLNTRYFEVSNHELAKSYIERAIAFADQIENKKRRSFHTVFNQNGLALIEMHLGNLDGALELVTEGWELLNRTLEANEQLLHRSVLLHNQAQLLAAKKDWDAAVDRMNDVIRLDPHYAEYYFDRGSYNSHRGHLEESIRDYDQAMKYSPPFPEVYYNRAGVLKRLGEIDLAMRDYNYLLELDPDHRDGLLNRATLFYESDRLEDARRDVLHGLRIDEANAELLCTLGLIEMADGNVDEAQLAFSRALASNPDFTEALTNRAVLYYECHQPELAIKDLNQALTLQENATTYYNRAWVYESLGQWDAAISDYRQARTFDDADHHDIHYRIGLCCLQVGDREMAREEWIRHLTFGETPYGENIRLQMPELAIHLLQSVSS
ncbi:tetratricopeptide repeat protein [Cohnella panacarvi]|uniref:tetratricopeptide repeat protein n=1 Tax=Cohnella panacarvi TaxID=400776 RepID=UPI00047D38AC|nr:tetratricopeptide repeat protein [Cohnella panacarvi]